MKRRKNSSVALEIPLLDAVDLSHGMHTNRAFYSGSSGDSTILFEVVEDEPDRPVSIANEVGPVLHDWVGDKVAH